MKLEVVAMKPWQSKVLNATATLIGIRGEDVWCMTVTKDAVEQYIEEKKKETYEGTAYCVSCKENRQFTGWVHTSDSGRRMARGKCPICNTIVNRVLGKA